MSEKLFDDALAVVDEGAILARLDILLAAVLLSDDFLLLGLLKVTRYVKLLR